MVARLVKRGMPAHSVAAAEEWRRMHLDQALTKDARRPMQSAPAAPRSFDVGQIVADLVAAAGEDLVALLVAENLVVDVATGNLAVSAVAVALGDALDRSGGDSEALEFVAGPLSYGPPEAELAARRVRIEARIAEFRAMYGDSEAAA